MDEEEEMELVERECVRNPDGWTGINRHACFFTCMSRRFYFYHMGKRLEVIPTNEK